jgi:hypothetical protein
VLMSFPNHQTVAAAADPMQAEMHLAGPKTGWTVQHPKLT